MQGVDVVANCIEAIRKHPVLLVPQLIIVVVAGIIGVLLIAPVLSSLILTNSTNPAPGAVLSTLSNLIPGFIILVVITAIMGLIVEGMYMDMVSKWKNESLSLRDAFDTAILRFVDLFLYSLIILVIEGAILLLLFSSALSSVVGLMSSPTTASPSMIVTALAGIIGAVLIGVVLVIVLGPLVFTGTTIVVLEKAGPIKALMSSIEIGRQHFFSIIGVFIIFAIAYSVIYAIILILSIIPYIGGILSIIIAIFLGTFAQILAPMYYVTFIRPTSTPSTSLSPTASNPTPKPKTPPSRKRKK